MIVNRPFFTPSPAVGQKNLWLGSWIPFFVPCFPAKRFHVGDFVTVSAPLMLASTTSGAAGCGDENYKTFKIPSREEP